MKYTSKILLILLFLTPILIFSQNTKLKRKLYASSQKYFNNEDYSNALPYLIQLDSLDENNYETKYYIGVCYLNLNNKEKALPYLEFAIDKKESSIPYDIFKDLGEIYHKKYQFDKSLNFYKKYLKASPVSEKLKYEISRLIDYAKNGKVIIKDSLDVKISKLENNINSIYSETTPLISADENILFFERIIKMTGIDIDSVKNVFMSKKIDGIWSNPEKLIFENNNIKFSLSGISSDGAKIFLSYNSNLYLADVIDNRCININFMNNVNSDYWEYFASITPDGNEIYFSSNRVGGYGGNDIYKISRKIDGSWTNPENLGNRINSAADEDYPIIHADKKTLYFCSNGSYSIGGYDIFKSTLHDKNIWTKPKNIGYPINSTNDDLSFSVSASGKFAYVSRKNISDLYNNDLFKITYNNSVPLTLVKGTILAGNPLKPISAKIKIIDKESNQIIKYVYNPNPETGKFLLIFPPGKNYDMLIQSNDFLPQLINIYIPNQTYFYELFQEIKLKPITTLGKVIGEEVIIKNTFYDVFSLNDRSLSDTLIPKKNYEALINLIEEIISTTDSIKLAEMNFKTENLYSISKENNIKQSKNYSTLLDLVNKAIETTDSTSLELLNLNTVYEDKTTVTYFYSETNENNMIPYIIANDTIYTKPHINTIEKEDFSYFLAENSQYDSIINYNHLEKANLDLNKINQKDKKIIFTYSIPYLIEKIYFNEKHKMDLLELAQLILNNKSIYAELISYIDNEKQLNDEFSISKLRLNKLSEFLLKSGMPIEKFSYSEIKKDNKTEIIELKIFELYTQESTITIMKDSIDDSKNNQVTYKIQLRASMKAENNKSSYFKNLTVKRYYHNGMYKFVTGEFDNLDNAKKELEKIIKMGFIDAFIVVFKNEKRVNHNEAKKYLNIE